MATRVPSFPVGVPVVRPDGPGSGQDDGEGGGAAVLERQAQRVQPPRMYQVVLLNDDFTPMEFVVMLLQEFFGKDHETATQIMLAIHRGGRGVCGIYSRDVAATKVEQVMEAAQQAGHPLQAVSEPVE